MAQFAKDMREVFRVLKPGGTLCLIAEVFKGANTATVNLAEKYMEMAGLNLMTADEHRELLAGAGFAQVQILTQKSWLCATAKKP